MNENTTLTFELTVQETNLVLQSLGNMSYVQVAGLVTKISQVAQAQVEEMKTADRLE